jgi:N-acetylglucosaminyl-diphospho-decaprenol L-rhamnosyltransferase
MATLKDLTISVISHGHGRLLDELLEDLDRTSALSECRVIVTINVADPQFPAGKWRGSKIEWIYNDVPKGFGANHNRALSTAQSRWILVVNPDIRLPGDTLQRLLADAPDHPAVGIIAPQIVSMSGEIEDSVRRNLSPGNLALRWCRRLLGLPAESTMEPRRSADWFAGMFLLMPTRVFLAVRGFNERFYLYCEDYDLCIRVSLLGKSLLLNQRRVIVHNAQRSSHRRVKYLLWHIRSLLIVWCSRSFWMYTIKRTLKKLHGVSQLEV